MKIFILFFMFISISSYGSLNPAVVKESALKHHPSILAAIEKNRSGQEAVIGAKGAFDAVAVSDYKRQTKQAWNTEISRTQIEKPLRLANSKFYIGHEYIKPNVNGRLAPIYNSGNPAGLEGGYKVIGAKISLWKILLSPKKFLKKD